MNRLVLNIPEEEKNLMLMDIQFLHVEREKDDITISGKIYFQVLPGDVIDREIKDCWVVVDGIKRSQFYNLHILPTETGPYYDFQAKGLTHYVF